MADFVGNLLLSSFSNLTKAQVAGFVAGLLNPGMDLTTFKLHLRDFLVTLKVCACLYGVVLYAVRRSRSIQVVRGIEPHLGLLLDLVFAVCPKRVREKLVATTKQGASGLGAFSRQKSGSRVAIYMVARGLGQVWGWHGSVNSYTFPPVMECPKPFLVGEVLLPEISLNVSKA